MSHEVKPCDDELVERVAQAIWHAQWEEAWPREGGIEHAHALEVARAAIEAMSRPTVVTGEHQSSGDVAEIEPMTEAEHIATLVALATMLDRSGCPAASITEATDEGVSIALHFSADRARKLIAAQPEVNQ